MVFALIFCIQGTVRKRKNIANVLQDLDILQTLDRRKRNFAEILFFATLAQQGNVANQMLEPLFVEEEQS